MKYDTVITNPPYMANKRMDRNLIDFLKSNYNNMKSDLITIFMDKTFTFVQRNGYMSMINPSSLDVFINLLLN